MFKKIDDYTMSETKEKILLYRLPGLISKAKGLREQLDGINNLIAEAKKLGLKEKEEPPKDEPVKTPNN